MALDVDTVRVAGRWFKHAFHGSAPLAHRDPPPDNRWQRGDVVDALYLADEGGTAWAEWYRHLAERGVPPGQQMPRDLWTWEIDAEVADLSAASRLARVDLAVPRPGRSAWPPYQVVGEELHAAGWAGLVAPSAARPEHMILCLFREQDAVLGATPLSPPETVGEPPAPPTGMTT